MKIKVININWFHHAIIVAATPLMWVSPLFALLAVLAYGMIFTERLFAHLEKSHTNDKTTGELKKDIEKMKTEVNELININNLRR